MDDDPIYLSYKSCCLRKSDIKCFTDFHRLNDLSISFYYEMLTDKYSNNDFILLDPRCRPNNNIRRQCGRHYRCIWTIKFK